MEMECGDPVLLLGRTHSFVLDSVTMVQRCLSRLLLGVLLYRRNYLSRWTDSDKCQHGDTSRPSSSSMTAKDHSAQTPVTASISQNSVKNLGMRLIEESSNEHHGIPEGDPMGLSVPASDLLEMQRK